MGPGAVTDAYAVTAGLLFGLALYGLLVSRHLLRRLMAANVMASSVFLYLVVVAARRGETVVDPVPQALVLTGIVIAVAITAFAVGLTRWLEAQRQTAGGARRPDKGGEQATSAHD